MKKLALAGALMLAASLAATATGTPRDQAALCPSAYTAITKALTVLQAHLDGGITYNQYEDYLTNVRVAYDQEPVARASLACLHEVGIPTEQAMNDYILAGNSWSACNKRIFANLATSCVAPNSYGQGSRQIFWQRAAAATQRAVNNLG